MSNVLPGGTLFPLKVYTIRDENRFQLDRDFVADYVGKQPNWGYGLLSYVTYKRTYARRLTKEQVENQYRKYTGSIPSEISLNEEYWQTLVRVVEGVSSIYKQHVTDTGQPWSDAVEQEHAQEMFRRMWAFKFTPPGRGFWGMGTEALELKGSAILNNCGFISTEHLEYSFSEPFCALMDYSMLGVGMGFDVLGAGKTTLSSPKFHQYPYTIEDSREGWIEAIRITFDAFVGKASLPASWDFSRIREEGAPLTTFGGTASGYGPLQKLLGDIFNLCMSYVGKAVDSTFIVDAMNMIGVCVVAGNVRRSSEIALGSPSDEAFMGLKNNDAWIAHAIEQSKVLAEIPEYAWAEEAIKGFRQEQANLSVLDEAYAKLQASIDKIEARKKEIARSNAAWKELQAKIDSHPLMTHRWASNNTVLCEVGKTDYSKIAEYTIRNGEPGYGWPEVFQAYGRLADPPEFKDKKAKGFNPCQPGNAKVLTPAGIRLFDQINVGDTVWTGKEWTKVINKVYTGVKKVYKYATTAGYFLGTENHRIVSKGTKIEVKDASSIDLAVGPSTGVEPLDPHAILDGLVIGDGYFHKASNRNFLVQGRKDADWDTSEISHLLGRKVERPDSGIFVRYVLSTLPELVGLSTRRVPQKYLYGSSREVKAFLRGLFSANGSICGTRVTLKAISKGLIEDVQAMLSSIGIASYYTTNKPHDVEFTNGTYTCKESYDLNISTKKGREAFYHQIGFLQAYKMEKLQKIVEKPKSPFSSNSSKTTFDVVSVEFISEEDVYDITVEADSHVYWSNGLLVSNCGEQTLHDHELCCLVETYPTKHESLDDFLETLKYAYRYAKAVTLVPTHNKKTNAVMVRNRRIGTSMAGLVELYCRLKPHAFKEWLNRSYEVICEWDTEYSSWLGVNESIKKTSVKPGGTVPLLVGVEGGMKAPTSRYYMRTIRIDHISPLVEALRVAGYRVEKDRTTPRTMVCYFPMKTPEGVSLANEMSLWEQANLFTMLQKHWSDNMVSATLTFREHEKEDIAKVLYAYEGQWKAVSFLPLFEHGFPQAPYIPCTKEEYEQAMSKLSPIYLDGAVISHDTDDKFCSGGLCEIAPAS